MELKIFELKLENNELERRDIPKVRGYLANKFPQYIELHNHIDGDKFRYGYPLIQYKTIGKTPYIIGINEGADVLMKIEDDIEDIDIRKSVVKVYEKGYTFKKSLLKEREDMVQYRFITPWMALNQMNHRKYLELDQWEDKVKLLESILKGNLLSLCKNFDYRIQKHIEILLKVRPIKVNFKNNTMVAFKGKFKVNIDIPDYLGIGKSVSRGFGTIKRS
ncbi:MAG: CRISPR-associated endonuclease Cas6 [Marinisporobacter sp.]|jgi:hypothetical protein|nr:CRISPR-associated endonuclease Cas6 [Marinisporobacter sp.]